MENCRYNYFSKKMPNIIRKAAVTFLVFLLANCYGDDGFYNRNKVYKSSPYAVPMPVRQPSAPAPNYQQPYYHSTPNSRMYYNPYEFQQPYGSNPYMDYDQYYVPPTQYYNNEYYNIDSDQGFSGKT